jgi:hypothetical protein
MATDAAPEPTPEPEQFDGGYREHEGKRWYWVRKDQYSGIPDPARSRSHTDDDGVEWWLLPPEIADPRKDWMS